MRKIKRVLDLKARGLSQRAISHSCGISQSTVSDYLRAAAAAGVQWPEASEWEEAEIERKLYPRQPVPEFWRKHHEPDWLSIQPDLLSRKELTLQLVWEEYRIGDAGYSYSRFCELYRNWLQKLDLVLRHEHRAGEKMFVDYAGSTIPIHNANSGEFEFEAAIFVAVLGASNYTFAEASVGQGLASWIGSHLRAFEFFGGVTLLRRTI